MRIRACMLAILVLSGCRPSTAEVIVEPVVLASPGAPAYPRATLRLQSQRVVTLHRTARIAAALPGEIVVEWPSHPQHRQLVYLDNGRHLVIFVPPEWRITGGTFAGVQVPMQILFPNSMSAPSVFDGGLKIWQEYPVPVYLTDMNAAVSANDTAPLLGVMLAQVIANIQRAVGKQVFSYGGYVDKTVPGRAGIYVQSVQLTGAVLGQTELRLTNCDGMPSWVSTCFPELIAEATLNVRPDVEAAILEHELLHALGLSHTCIVGSVLATEFSRHDRERCAYARRSFGLLQPLLLRRELSAYDVAAIEVAMELSRSAGMSKARHIHWIMPPLLPVR